MAWSGVLNGTLATAFVKPGVVAAHVLLLGALAADIAGYNQGRKDLYYSPDDCPANQLDFDFLLGRAESVLNNVLVDEFGESLWDADTNPLWQQIPGQTGPGFAGVDNDGNGIDDDDHFDLLAAIIDGDETVVAGLDPLDVAAIRAAYAANLARVRTIEYTLENIHMQATALGLVNIDTIFAVTTSETTCISVPVVGETCFDVPSLWGVDGVLADSDPLLERLIAENAAVYLTIGDTAGIAYIQNTLSALLPTITNYFVPQLISDVKKNFRVTSKALDCGDVQPLALDFEATDPVQIVGTLEADAVDMCNSFNAFTDQLSCENGFDCQTPLLAATGNLNGTSNNNSVSYQNASRNRQAWMAAEGIANPPLQITSNPLSQSVSPGEPVTMSIAYTGGKASATRNFLWQTLAPNSYDPLSTAALTEQLSLSDPQFADSGLYTGTVCDGLWRRQSQPASLSVASGVFRITQQPVGTALHTGQALSLTVETADGVGALNYVWKRNGVDVGNAQTLEITEAAPGDTGSYRCEITDSVETVVSDTVQVYVVPLGSGEELFAVPEVLDFGTEDTVLSLSVSNSGAASTLVQFLVIPQAVNWIQSITPETAQSLNSASGVAETVDVVIEINRSLLAPGVNTGIILVGPTDPESSATTQVVTVKATESGGAEGEGEGVFEGEGEVGDPLEITSQPLGVTVYTGESVVLSVEATGGTGTVGYRWKRGTTTVGFGETLTIVDAQVSASGNYFCEITDDVTTLLSDTVLVRVAAPGSGEEIVVSSDTLDFGFSQTQLNLEIFNGGQDATLARFELVPQFVPWIVSIEPATGQSFRAASGGAEVFESTIIINRALLAPGFNSGTIVVGPTEPSSSATAQVVSVIAFNDTGEEGEGEGDGEGALDEVSMTRVVPAGGYRAGQRLRVELNLAHTGSGNVTDLDVTELFPAAWTYGALVSGPVGLQTRPVAGGVIFTIANPVFPASIVYEIDVPIGQAGSKSLVGVGSFSVGGSDLTFGSANTFIDSLATGEGESENGIEGIVRHRYTGAPLPNVSIIARGPSQSVAANTVTASDGSFTFSLPETAGPFSAQFVAAGFEEAVLQNLAPPQVVTVDLTPVTPLPPAGLAARVGKGRIDLTWTAGPEADLAGYHVYRRLQGAPADTRLTSVPAADPQFTDDTVSPGVAYTYRVTAVDTGGAESPKSLPVDATADTIEVWVPDVSGMPGDRVLVQINVRSAEGIDANGMQIDLAYPADLVDPAAPVKVERTAVTRFVAPLSNVVSPGLLRITFLGSLQEKKLLRGEGHIFDVYLELKDDAPAGASGELRLDEVTLFDDAVPPQPITVNIAPPAILRIEEGCRRGDLNGDNKVNIGDVLFAQQVAVELIASDPCLMQSADLNGDGVIDSADALMLQRLVVGLPINPPQPGAKGDLEELDEFVPEVAPEVAPGVVFAAPGETVSVPLYIENGKGVSGGDLSIAYTDTPGVFSLASVEQGPLTQDFLFLPNLTTPGVAKVLLNRQQGLGDAQSEGIIARLEFEVGADVAPGRLLPLNLNLANLKLQFGDSFRWYTAVVRQSGGVRVIPPGYQTLHNADADFDKAIGLSELLRVIQFFNLEEYYCDAASEDGFGAGAGARNCTRHTADYTGEAWRFELEELLRLIQLYNAGAYTATCPPPAAEDGFCIPN